MENKRNQLVNSAIGLFIKHGIISVTMDEVARASGMSKKTVYQYFANKGILVEAVVDLLIKQGENIIRLNVDTANDPVQELSLQQDLFKHLIALRYIFSDFILKRYPRAFKAFQEFKTDYMKAFIETNLKHGVEKGLYHHNLDVPSTVNIYLSVTDFLVFNNSRNYADIFVALNLFINGITTANGRQLYANYLKSS